MTVVCWATANPHAGERGAWDMQIIEELTAGPGYEHRVPDEHTTTTWANEPIARNLGSSWVDEGAVVVVAGQHNATDGYADAIALFVASLPWALTIVTSDEEALFPVDLLPRDDRHQVWTQYHDRGMDRVIPIGAQPGTARALASMPVEAVVGGPARDLAVSFIGQDTHERRHELLATIKDMAVGRYGNIAWLATTGFRQGVDQAEYLATLRRTRIAPCPSGPHSLDSFRLYEALAAGALPVIEACTPHGYEVEFWQKMFGPGCPLPILTSWEALPSFVEQMSQATEWQAYRDRVQEWWHVWRLQLGDDFRATIERLQNG